MDELAARELLAAVIARAVKDRRQAVSRGLIDDKALPSASVADGDSKRNSWGMVSGLHYFFHKGGLEVIVSLAGFELNTDLIKRKSEEPYDE